MKKKNTYSFSRFRFFFFFYSSRESPACGRGSLCRVIIFIVRRVEESGPLRRARIPGGGGEGEMKYTLSYGRGTRAPPPRWCSRPAYHTAETIWPVCVRVCACACAYTRTSQRLCVVIIVPITRLVRRIRRRTFTATRTHAIRRTRKTFVATESLSSKVYIL